MRTTPKALGRSQSSRGVDDGCGGAFAQTRTLVPSGPVSRWYGISIRVGDGRAEVRIPVRPEFFHAAGAVHGSVYFRALDDAAFFAVNSRVLDVLVLTVGFTIHLMNPISQGELIAEGRMVHEAGRLFVAESELRDQEGRLLAKGSGTFTRSKVALSDGLGYSEGPTDVLKQRGTS